MRQEIGLDSAQIKTTALVLNRIRGSFFWSCYIL